MAKRTISMGRSPSSNFDAPISQRGSNYSKRLNNLEKASQNKRDIDKTPICFIEETDEQSIKAAESGEKSSAEKSAPALFKSEMKRGIITENPVLRLALGACPALAVTGSASDAIGMGRHTGAHMLKYSHIRYEKHNTGQSADSRLHNHNCELRFGSANAG